MRTARAARWAAFAALALAVFEACTSTNDTTTVGPSGPPAIAIMPTATEPLAVACDDSLTVHLVFTNWMLQVADTCGTSTDCGSVLVTLLGGADGTTPLATARAATADVQLDLSALVNPKAAGDATLNDVKSVKAELIDDALRPYPVSVGSKTVDQADLTLTLPSNCPADGGAGMGSAGGASGAAGASAGGAGAAGMGGAGGVNGAGAAAGEVATAGALPI